MQKGQHCSAETKAKISVANKGRKLTPDQHARFCIAMQNRSPETNKKMGASIKKLWEDPDYRDYMSEVHRKPLPEAQRAKMIAGIKKRFDEDPEYHKKLSDAQLKRYQDPMERNTASDNMRRIAARPGESERRRERMKAYWDEERKKEHGNKVRKLCEDPVYREQMRERSKLVWARPGEHEKRSGENAPMWNGGSSFEPYCDKFNRQLKEQIRDEFGRKCFLCDCRENGERLHVHHIDYNKLQGCRGRRWALIPLCKHCHAKTIKTRWYWFNLFINYWALNPEINLF